MTVIEVAKHVGARVLEPRDVHDAALVGVVVKHGQWVGVYDIELLVAGFRELNGWDHETAMEWIAFNCTGAVEVL